MPSTEEGLVRGRRPRLVLVAAFLGLSFLPAALAEPEILALQAPRVRQLAGSEAHLYEIALAPGDFLRVVAGQEELDLRMTVRDPAGQVLLDVDAPTGQIEPEILSLIAAAAGSHQIQVSALSGPSTPRTYRIVVESLRPAGPEEQADAAEASETSAADAKLNLATPDELGRALRTYQTALERSRRLDRPDREAALLFRIGLVHQKRNEWSAALASFDPARTIYRRLGDARGLAGTLSQLGRTFRTLGDNAAALEALAESLKTWTDLGVPGEQANVRINLGHLHHTTGETDRALADYREALALLRGEGRTAQEIVVLNNLGGLEERLGRPQAALGLYRQALDLVRPLGRPGLEARIRNNIGVLLMNVGQIHEALEEYSAALPVFRGVGDGRGEAAVLHNLGDLLLDLGVPEQAAPLLEQARQLERATEDRRSEVDTLLLLARAAREQGRHAEAGPLLDEALTLQRPLGDAAGEAAVRIGQALLFQELGRLDSAQEAATQALELARRGSNPAREAAAQRLLGALLAAQGRPESARPIFEEALRIARDRGDVPEQAKVLREMGRAAQRAGDLQAAREHLRAAIGHFESLRSEIAGDRFRLSHFAVVRDTYESYVDALMRLHAREPGQGYAVAALEAAEQARARGLFDVLRQARVEVRDGDPELLARERQLRWELSSKAALRLQAPGGAELDRQIEELEAEYQIVDARLRSRSPWYATLRQPDIRLAEVQREVLDGETAVLEFVLAEPRSYLWRVTSGAVEPFELPGRGEIQELARRVHERLGDPSAGDRSEERRDLQELSRLLLGPALDRLDPGVRRLVMVADGALHYVPFAVLPVAGPQGEPVPLVARFELVSLPSMAVLREMRRAATGRQAPPTALAVLADPVFDRSDPRLLPAGAPAPEGGTTASVPDPVRLSGDAALSRLAWSGREAESIAAAARGRDLRLALGFSARRELALSPDLAGYRILHFATHGILDAEHPELSALVFSQLDEQGRPVEGFLRLRDIYGLRLRSDLVVLSGCQTALGKQMHGEGLIGLAYGFLHAGASQVLASLWTVRDRATAELMERFYRGIFRQGLRPAAALRQAQLALSSERTTRDPYFWGAFVLQGDWQAFAADPAGAASPAKTP